MIWKALYSINPRVICMVTLGWMTGEWNLYFAQAAWFWSTPSYSKSRIPVGQTNMSARFILLSSVTDFAAAGADVRQESSCWSRTPYLLVHRRFTASRRKRKSWGKWWG